MTDYHAQIEDDLTPEVLDALQMLRDRGFSVCAFSPTELRGADPDAIEEAMTRMGWDAIDMDTASSAGEEVSE
jgi:hypothetical protein